MIALTHGRNQGFYQGQGCPVVDLKSPTRLVVIANYPLQASCRSTGIVDQDVDAAETLDRLCGNFGCGAALGEIGHQDLGPLVARSGDLLCELFE